MKLGLLSTSPKCYSTARLRQAADERGHDVKVLNTLRFAIDLESGEPDLYFRSKELTDYDAIIPRIGASITYFGTANGISNSRDKLRSMQILSRHEIGIPYSTFVRASRGGETRRS